MASISQKPGNPTRNETQTPLPGRYPSPLRSPTRAHLTSLYLTWARSGSRKESNFRAGRKAISASTNHARQGASLPARPEACEKLEPLREGSAGNRETGDKSLSADGALLTPPTPQLSGAPASVLPAPRVPSRPRWVSLAGGCCAVGNRAELPVSVRDRQRPASLLPASSRLY